MASELKPAYLITGSDRPKVARAVRRLRERMGADAAELLSAGETSGDEAVAACNALGLFGGGARLVVVEEVERWKAADAKAVTEYLAAPAPGTVRSGIAWNWNQETGAVARPQAVDTATTSASFRGTG